MIDASGGIANFIAILIPAIMGTFYGFRCLFQTEGFIEQYGLGAASAVYGQIMRDLHHYSGNSVHISTYYVTSWSLVRVCFWHDSGNAVSYLRIHHS